MSKQRKYKVVSLETTDRQDVFASGDIDAVYSLNDWDHVLILHVGPNFNINAHADKIRKTFGYGTHRPIIFTRSPIAFFTVEAVDSTPGILARVWTRIKSWVGIKPSPDNL